MLKIAIPVQELFNAETDEFEVETVNVNLEHSLLSLSKWEEKHQKPFLVEDARTAEELFDYIVCMVLPPEPSVDTLHKLSEDNVKAINEYIGSLRTATTFPDGQKSRSREIVTSELIYFWMIHHNIPFECAEWHLSRLLTLIRVCNVKTAPAKKMSKTDIAARNRRLNEERRAKYNTRG